MSIFSNKIWVLKAATVHAIAASTCERHVAVINKRTIVDLDQVAFLMLVLLLFFDTLPIHATRTGAVSTQPVDVLRLCQIQQEQDKKSEIFHNSSSMVT